jgi:ribokinase
MDGVYFTGGDASALRFARAGKQLVATPRAAAAFAGSDVMLDALVRSAKDAGERAPCPARITIATRGPEGGTYEDEDGRTGSFPAVALPGPVADAYGAGDSFAAGLTFGLGSGMALDAALGVAARCGAGNLTQSGPYAGQPTAADLKPA